jgi:hypothetical protein
MKSMHGPGAGHTTVWALLTSFSFFISAYLKGVATEVDDLQISKLHPLCWYRAGEVIV